MTNKFFFLVMFAAAYSSQAFAQSCATPIAIVAWGAVTGNTCTGTVQLPSLIGGAVQNSNQQIVYRATLATPTNVQLVLLPDGSTDMSMFVCSNQCSTVATCIAADANGAGGAESAVLPNARGDYYVIVQSSNGTSPACGTYTLSVAAPLGD